MIKYIAVFVLSIFLFSFSQAQEKVHFRVNPEKGKSLNYEMIIKSDIEGDEDVIMDIGLLMSLTPTSLSDSSIIIEAKYPKLTMDIHTAMMTINYNSSIASNDEMSQMLEVELRPLIDNIETITMNRNGVIKDSQFPNVTEQAFDKSNLKTFAISFPEEEIAIGDSWFSPSTKGQFGLLTKVNNTLIGLTDDGYRVDISGIYLDDNGEEIGKIEGHYIVDRNTHFTKSSSSNGSIEFDGQKITSSITLRLIN